MNGENLVSLVSRLAKKQRKLRKNARSTCGPTVTEAVIELPQPRLQAALEYFTKGCTTGRQTATGYRRRRYTVPVSALGVVSQVIVSRVASARN